MADFLTDLLWWFELAPVPIDDPQCVSVTQLLLGRDEFVQSIANIVTGGQVSYFKLGEGGWVPSSEVTDASAAIGTGVSTVTGTLDPVPVVHGSVTITQAGLLLSGTDEPNSPYDGSGKLFAPLGNQVGIINYKTGAWLADWDVGIPGGIPVASVHRARGRRGSRSADLDTSGGSVGPFAKTVGCAPIVPGSVVVTDNDTQFMYDDGAGGFTGGAAGTINYVTGAISVTFSNPTPVGFATRATWEIDEGGPVSELFTDLVSANDDTLYTFQKDLDPSVDMAFQGAGTGTVRITVAVDTGEANDDGFGESPYFFEGGLFTENDVMVCYFTFPKKLKDNSVSISRDIDLKRTVS